MTKANMTPRWQCIDGQWSTYHVSREGKRVDVRPPSNQQLVDGKNIRVQSAYADDIYHPVEREFSWVVLSPKPRRSRRYTQYAGSFEETRFEFIDWDCYLTSADKRREKEAADHKVREEALALAAMPSAEQIYARLSPRDRRRLRRKPSRARVAAEEFVAREIERVTTYLTRFHVVYETTDLPAQILALAARER